MLPANSEWVAFFFSLHRLFFQGTEITKFVNEKIAAVHACHTSRRRRIPMPASPRNRARCDRHEARLSPLYRVVSYCSAMEVSALLLRSTSVLAANCLLLTLTGDERGRSKALIFGVFNGTSDVTHQKHPRKTSSPIASAFPPRAAIIPLLDWLPRCVAHDSSKPKKPVALGHDSASFVVKKQQWRACVRKRLRCRLACILPPSSLDPRLASGSLAVAEDEGRDRRPLDSREKGIGHSHLPYCPRLRRMIL